VMAPLQLTSSPRKTALFDIGANVDDSSLGRLRIDRRYGSWTPRAFCSEAAATRPAFKANGNCLTRDYRETGLVLRYAQPS
jgi:hypothetical protein